MSQVRSGAESRLCAPASARRFGLYPTKGAIENGADADFTIVRGGVVMQKGKIVGRAGSGRFHPDGACRSTAGCYAAPPKRAFKSLSIRKRWYGSVGLGSNSQLSYHCRAASSLA